MSWVILTTCSDIKMTLCVVLLLRLLGIEGKTYLWLLRDYVGPLPNGVHRLPIVGYTSHRVADQESGLLRGWMVVHGRGRGANVQRHLADAVAQLIIHQCISVWFLSFTVDDVVQQEQWRLQSLRLLRIVLLVIGLRVCRSSLAEGAMGDRRGRQTSVGGVIASGAHLQGGSVVGDESFTFGVCVAVAAAFWFFQDRFRAPVVLQLWARTAVDRVHR